MFFRLAGKEMKYQLKNVTIYLLLGIITLFYMTQFSPPDRKANLEPMNEINYIYNKLQEDYSNGTLSAPMMPGYNRKLASGEKEYIREAMEQLIPSDKYKGLNTEFKVSSKEYKEILDSLDRRLGGKTYYGAERLDNLLHLLRDSYGRKPITEPKEEIERVYSFLKFDLSRGQVLKMRLFINKYTKLSPSQKKVVEQALEEIAPDGYVDEKLKIEVSYDRYLEIIRKVDKELGGSTSYSDRLRPSLLLKPKTYEEAKEDFEDILVRDKFTNAWARYFADYMGITAGFFPVFLAAFILTRDRRCRMHELIYCRSVGALTYIASKFAAVVALVTLCYIPVTIHATWTFSGISEFKGFPADNAAFFRILLLWIVPTIMFTAACGMLVSVLFGNGVAAVPVQFILWMVSMLPLSGDYRLFKSVIRFNQVGLTDEYFKWKADILLNRGFFALLSILLIVITAAVWSGKRGAVDGFFKKPAGTAGV